MSKVVLFGIGKIADEAYYYLTNDSEHEVVAFTVDEAFMDREEKLGKPVIPFHKITDAYPPSTYNMFVALGYQGLNDLRATKYQQAKDKGYSLISYVSSKAGNFGDIEIGDNCFVLDNSTLQPFSKIGNNVTIWSNNIIGHHSTVEDHCYIAGHVSIAGHTTVGAYSFVGINALIGHGIAIGNKNLIGAGAIVTKNTEDKSVYIVPDTPKFRLDSTSFVKMTRL